MRTNNNNNSHKSDTDKISIDEKQLPTKCENVKQYTDTV